MRFADRSEAGRLLAARLQELRLERPIVLGLPRGGVPVAWEVARALDAPLDVWVVRKIGAPFEPEYGLGAATEGGLVYLDEARVAEVGESRESLRELIARKQREVAERMARFRGGRPAPDLRGRTVIVVDDGIATGGTVIAALRSIRAQGAERIVLAVPVAAAQSLSALRPLADDVVCLEASTHLYAIGAWYVDFSQTSDRDVEALLAAAQAWQLGGGELNAPA